MSPRSVPLNAPSSCSGFFTVHQEIPGRFETQFRAPARSHNGARACYGGTRRSEMISKKRLKAAVLSDTELCCTSVCPTLRHGALEWAARAPNSVPPERSQGLLKPPHGAPRALEGASQACSVPQDAPSGCSSLCSVCALRAAFRPPARCCRGTSSYLLCHWALDKAFENAARRICARLHLRSETLHSICSTLHCAWICTGSH